MYLVWNLQYLVCRLFWKESVFIEEVVISIDNYGFLTYIQYTLDMTYGCGFTVFHVGVSFYVTVYVYETVYDVSVCV